VTSISLIFALFIVIGFFCFLMAEIGVPPNMTRAVRICGWGVWFVASIIWAFVLRAVGAG
jgi:hypothetical protein